MSRLEKAKEGLRDVGKRDNKTNIKGAGLAESEVAWERGKRKGATR